MSTVKEPLHPLRTARYLWLGILLCALVGGACFLGGRWSAGRSETAKIDTVVLQNQLSEIRELATVTYAYTNMAQFESSNDFYGVKIPFTTKSFILMPLLSFSIFTSADTIGSAPQTDVCTPLPLASAPDASLSVQSAPPSAQGSASVAMPMRCVINSTPACLFFPSICFISSISRIGSMAAVGSSKI